LSAPPPDRADVVVIGAGIAGASAAYALSGDADVVVVEAEPFAGTHATGRSAALLNATVGDPVFCELARSSWAFLERPPAGFCDHPLLSDRGLLWVGDAASSATVDDIAAIGGDRARRIDTVQARRLVPLLAPEACAGGSVHEPGAKTIDVAALLASYLRAVRASGSIVSTSWEALTIVRRPDRWLVRCGDAEIATARVVNAAGAWGDVVARRAGVAPLGLRPLRRTAALVNAPDDVASWPMVMDVAGGWYAAPEPGGLLVSPGDESPSEPGDARADEIDVALAIDRVNAALGLELRSVRRAWAGLRTFCADRRPAVGDDAEHRGFTWLVGQGGGGIKTAPALAAIVADAVLRDVAPPAAIDPRRLR
jgi:D-arginine dehydrogenase